MEEKIKSNRLWTKNFSIITIGSIISMLGNSVSGFAIGLLVLDFTESVFLYALFMVMYNLPKIIVPLIAGPYLDRFSRRKTIYTLDFLSSTIYLILFLFINKGMFNYYILLLGTTLIGSIDSIYHVAYESFYPNLISEGNFSKAYSISSMIYPLASFMVPVASIVYDSLGTVAPLFLFNSVTFFIAACFETRIKYDESHILKTDAPTAAHGLKRYAEDFKDGISYLKSEKGLLTITTYFGITTLLGTAMGTLMLPFFKENPTMFSHVTSINIVTLYTIVTTCSVFGRLVGGIVHYKFKYPVPYKFIIAVTVYTTISVLDAIALYMPIILMCILFFIVGLFSVTSFNIRISATQSYIPDTVRARFNGVFNMVCSCGQVMGQLMFGFLGEMLPYRLIIAGAMAVNIIAVLLVMIRGREHVKGIYNRSV